MRGSIHIAKKQLSQIGVGPLQSAILAVWLPQWVLGFLAGKRVASIASIASIAAKDEQFIRLRVGLPSFLMMLVSIC